MKDRRDRRRQRSLRRTIPIKKAFVLPLDEFVAGWYDESMTKNNSVSIVNETLGFFS